MNPYLPDEPVIRVADILSTEIKGELVLLSVERQKYFSLRTTSQRIWELLEEPRTLAQICKRLVEEYDIEPQACEREAEIFLRNLWDERLIRPVGAANH